MTSESKRVAPRRWPSVVSSLGSTVLLALVPKCPLCVAAVLSSLGLGAAAASFLGPLLRPFAILLVLVAVVALAAGERRRVHARRAAHSCCSR
jgi:hypothetical protein